jgi:hypothetical protein
VTAASLQGSVATTVIGVDQAIRGLRKMLSDKRLAAKPIVAINDTLANYDLSGELARPVGSRSSRSNSAAAAEGPPPTMVA